RSAAAVRLSQDDIVLSPVDRDSITPGGSRRKIRKTEIDHRLHPGERNPLTEAHVDIFTANHGLDRKRIPRVRDISYRPTEFLDRRLYDIITNILKAHRKLLGRRFGTAAPASRE